MNETIDTIPAPLPSRFRADAAARAAQAWELRIAGHDWEHIADECGFAHASGAARAAKRYANLLPQPDREQVREELRAPVRWLWTQVRRDVEDRVPGASRAAVAVLQRWSAREGADEPTRLEVSPVAARVEQAITLLVQRQRALDGGGDAVEADVFEDDELVEDEPEGRPSCASRACGSTPSRSRSRRRPRSLRKPGNSRWSDAAPPIVGVLLYPPG